MTSKQDIISECWVLRFHIDGSYFAQDSCTDIVTFDRREAKRYHTWVDASMARAVNLNCSSYEVAIVHLVKRKKTPLADFETDWCAEDKKRFNGLDDAYFLENEKRLREECVPKKVHHTTPIVNRSEYYCDNGYACSSGTITVHVSAGDTRLIVEQAAGAAFMALAK